MRATNAEGTGEWSDAGTVTAAANTAPAFAETSYAFTLAENADGSTTPIAIGSGLGDRRRFRPHGELLHRGGQCR